MTRSSPAEAQATAQRIASLEAAFMELLGRVEVLEQALKFEVDQRVELEKVILRAAGLGKRVDRLEMVERAARLGRIAAFTLVEGGK